MKRVTGFAIIFIVTCPLLVACQRNQGVQAGNDDYQPRPAPTREVPKPEIKGELTQIDLENRTVVVRVENGMLQTFKFNEDTAVVGLVNQPGSLVGREGSELAVQWEDEDDTKIATAIEVTQLSKSRNSRHTKRR